MTTNEIKLSVSLYKYGYFNSTEMYKFNSHENVIEFIEEGLEYKKQVERDSKYYEENCEKWTAKFNYNNTDYDISLDL
jgi:hypothetical protein